MNETQLLKALKDRLPWRTLKRLLTANRYPVGIGLEDVLEKLRGDGGRRRDPAGLEQSYREGLVAGEKSINVYVCDEALMQVLRDEAREYTFDDADPFVQRYPLPVTQHELRSAALVTPRPVAYERFEGASVLVFSAVREFEFREPLTANELTENAANRYRRVIGLRTERRQTFDAVIVPDRGSLVYVVVDNPAGTTTDMRYLSQFATRQAANQFIGQNLLGSAANLFSLIEAFYNAPEEGCINLLSYSTVTASVKTEKMREPGKCLRVELFHKTGMAALGGQFKAYEVGVEWALPEVGRYTPHPTLMISGSYRLTYDRHPVVDEAQIRGCGSFSELQFVLDKIARYLPTPEIT